MFAELRLSLVLALCLQRRTRPSQWPVDVVGHSTALLTLPGVELNRPRHRGRLDCPVGRLLCFLDALGGPEFSVIRSCCPC